MLFGLPPARACLAASAAVGVIACARVESASDRHVSEMNEVIRKVQSEQDKSPKLGQIDGAYEDERSVAPPAPRPRASAKTAPPARVVSLVDDDVQSEDPNAPGERPEIKLVGAGGSSAVSRSRSRSSASASAGAGAGASDADARRAYDSAIALVDRKEYDRALEALNEFLVRFPDHPYAENAMYWRGEVYFAEGEYLRAAEQFEGVVARFRGGRKAPDALLKIGLCHEKLGAGARAREYFERLRREYPESDAARKIPTEVRPKETR